MTSFQNFHDQIGNNCEEQYNFKQRMLCEQCCMGHRDSKKMQQAINIEQFCQQYQQQDLEQFFHQFCQEAENFMQELENLLQEIEIEQFCQKFLQEKNFNQKVENFQSKLQELKNLTTLPINLMSESKEQDKQDQIQAEISYSDVSYFQLIQLLDFFQANTNGNSINCSYLNELFERMPQFKAIVNKFIHSINELFQEYKWEDRFLQYDGLKAQDGKLTKIQFVIHTTKERELHYILNDQILQTFKYYDLIMKPQIINNLEEIIHLQWIGEFDKNFRKVGLWQAKWKGENLVGCGGEYSLNGKKNGQWKETIKNFYDNAKVYEVGEYVDGLRKGYWKYIFENQEIGGGQYNAFGNKDGNWIDLSDMFWRDSQITYHGGYQNGQKVGRWDIWFNFDGKNEEIGGGSYDQEGNEIKQGYWVEIQDGFHCDSQVTNKGEYQNGKKFGKWDIWYNYEGKYEIMMLIGVYSGGGSYDEGGKEIKQGFWVEISDRFHCESQVTYQGEYNNGKKIGRWDIFFRNFHEKNFSRIGGGSYVEEYDGVKVGKWIDLDEGFMTTSQVTFQGEYQKGRKVNRWDIYLNYNGKNELIGGGLYDQQEGKNQSLVKLGKWVELGDGFNDCCQVTYQGEYSNNKKVGRWNSYFQGKLLGGGTYNENGIKHGLWVVLCDDFFMYNQVTYIGQFQNGEKVGQWHIMKVKFNDENLIFEKIGEKHYQFEKKY